MFIKLKDRFIVNTDEVALIKQVDETTMKVMGFIDPSSGKSSEIVNSMLDKRIKCTILFKQGQEIIVDDMTLDDLWNLGGFKK
jgi:hypothetical protein